MARQTAQEIKKDIWLCLGLLVLGVLTIVRVHTGPFNAKLAAAESITFATLPTVYAALLLGLTLIILFLSLRSLRLARAEQPAPTPATTAPARPAGGWTLPVRTWGTLLLLLVYVILLQFLPFALLTTLYLATMFVLYGQRSVFKVGLVSVLGGAGLHLLFITLLNLPL